jgi:hypothetical protein
MVENVAEMVQEKGVEKGGSFSDKLSDFNVATDFSYAKPTEWLGFRCIAIFHMKNENELSSLSIGLLTISNGTRTIPKNIFIQANCSGKALY